MATFSNCFMVHCSTNHNTEFYRSFFRRNHRFFFSFSLHSSELLALTWLKVCRFITKKETIVLDYSSTYYTNWALLAHWLSWEIENDFRLLWKALGEYHLLFSIPTSIIQKYSRLPINTKFRFFRCTRMLPWLSDYMIRVLLTYTIHY